MEIVNDWFGLSPNLDDFTRGRYDAGARWALSRCTSAPEWLTADNKIGNVRNASVELVLPLEDADGESTANKSKK
jgi:hypothetical protein